MAKKLMKFAVDYGRGSMRDHCGVCHHFVKPDSCTKVQGMIEPTGWCKLFYRHTIRGTEHKEKERAHA